MRALTLLAVQRLALEASQPDPINADEAAFIRARSAPAMIQIAGRQRVIQMLGSVGDVFTDADWYQPARLACREAQWRSMSHAAVTHRVMRALQAVDARPLLVKGMALAALTTGDYSSRGLGDIDLVVAPESSDDAVDAIIAVGGQVMAGSPVRNVAQARTHYIHSTTLTLEGIHIDLHHRIEHNPMLMSVGHDALVDERSVVDVGGVGVDTLGLLDSTLLAACHSGHDAWSDLRSVMDMVRLFRLVGVERAQEQLWRRAQTQSVGGRLALAQDVGRRLGDTGPGGDGSREGLLRRRTSRGLARAAWRRLALGESVRLSREPRDRVFRNTIALASAGLGEALAWELRRLVAGEGSRLLAADVRA